MDISRGELPSPSHDTGVFPYLWKQWHLLPLDHSSHQVSI
jgi:hypothetical protein